MFRINTFKESDHVSKMFLLNRTYCIGFGVV